MQTLRLAVGDEAVRDDMMSERGERMSKVQRPLVHFTGPIRGDGRLGETEEQVVSFKDDGAETDSALHLIQDSMLRPW